ncbi:MAG: CapA family protein [Ignavibacteria bacterium]|jgi:poly-gamma-glutamate capsule biosynthesis protein CapA/YwtB (metallophosphatase superfamily)
MRLLFPVFMLCVIMFHSCKGDDSQHEQMTDSVSVDSTITLVFAGDMMSHMPMVKAAYNPQTKRHEYAHWFQFLEDTIQSADAAIANLETPLGGEPYSGYPMFSAPDSFAEDLKKVGFDVLVTANNHTVDKGRKGLERTLTVLDSLKIKHTGSFRNEQEREASTPLILQMKGVKIAILSYTYGTNGISVPKPNVVNLIDYARMEQDIIKARKDSADLVIPVIHWGVEYQTYEHPSQVKTAEFLASKGVDAIIGMHPHVVQPNKYIKTKNDSIPVAYSLGNVVANMRDRYKDGGILVRLTIKKSQDKPRIVGFEDIPFWVWKGSSKEVKGIHGFYIVPESKKYVLPASEAKKAQVFYDDTRVILKK